VDFQTQLRLTRELVDIDSTTGHEGQAGVFLARMLRSLGYQVVEQPVTGDRFNVVAAAGQPVVVFSTHMDCVPPFFPSREEGGRLYGRGSCDAKGIALAQIAAAERLRAGGLTDVGLLFVVGEERGSDGARLANTIASGSRFLINGEPTGNRLGRATRGIYRLRLRAHGRAAHSSLPHLGESAIEKLLDALGAMRHAEWPTDPDLGATHYIVAMIQGGVAPNVIPPEAHAEIMFRTVGDHTAVRERMVSAVGMLVEVEEVYGVPPVRLATSPLFETAVFSFATDVPLLDRWGTPLLLGPGAIEVAHTADEHVPLDELERAVDLYVTLARSLVRPV
jgi:acetylornithine deacetylase